MEQQVGRVLGVLGGFYTVKTEQGIVECRGRGTLRRQGLSPVAGDLVRVSVQEDQTGALEELLPRKNALRRPPVANVDCLVLVVSVTDPAPNLPVLDAMIALAEEQEIEPVIVLNKTDLEDGDDLCELYRKAGFSVFSVSAATGEGMEALLPSLAGKICVFSGNSGVGKSSLLNRLDPRLGLSTGETSRKLGRGRHTTRATVLYEREDGGFFADTPGFSSLELPRLTDVPPENLPFCFREFLPYLGNCKFTSCRHVSEKGCAVCAAVEAGEIAPSRHQSYCAMLKELDVDRY